MTPTLKTTSVTIAYSASDGYSTKVGYSSRRAPTPEQVLFDAIDELARIATLFGHAERAIRQVNEAVYRTQATLEARAARQQS